MSTSTTHTESRAPEPSAAAMRSAIKIREALERMNAHFRPSQTEWETNIARDIDREFQPLRLAVKKALDVWEAEPGETMNTVAMIEEMARLRTTLASLEPVVRQTNREGA